MKTLRQLLLLSALVSTGGLLAVTHTQDVKKSIYKKKQTQAQKDAVKKHVTRHPTHPAHAKTNKVAAREPVKHTPRTAKTTAAATAPRAGEKSTTSRIGEWLGYGAAGTAATAATSAAASTHVVKHRGPADFFEHHRFPNGWTQGWTSAVVKGEWVFAGHNLDWWKKNYPAYYKDVVRPEYTKTQGK